jgi:hypothetical protein
MVWFQRLSGMDWDVPGEEAIAVVDKRDKQRGSVSDNEKRVCWSSFV